LIAVAHATRIDQLIVIARDHAPHNPINPLVAIDLGAGSPQLVRSSAQIAQDSLDIRDQLQNAGNPENPTWQALFPNTGLGNQLRQVAKLIKTSREFLTNVHRQIFFVSLGGFDTHNNQGTDQLDSQGQFTGNQAKLWVQVSQAMTALYQATVELGVADRVTQFTISDFSRTFKPANPGSGVGSDHAWGGHHFVVGDAVNPGGVSDFYGTYPDVHLGADGDYDLGTGSRGRWIPKQSVDQYGFTLANWFGLQPGDDVSYVFPNLGRFDPPDLGFMAPAAGVSVKNRASANLFNRSSRR